MSAASISTRAAFEIDIKLGRCSVQPDKMDLNGSSQEEERAKSSAPSASPISNQDAVEPSENVPKISFAEKPGFALPSTPKATPQNTQMPPPSSTGGGGRPQPSTMSALESEEQEEATDEDMEESESDDGVEEVGIDDSEDEEADDDAEVCTIIIYSTFVPLPGRYF